MNSSGPCPKSHISCSGKARAMPTRQRLRSSSDFGRLFIFLDSRLLGKVIAEAENAVHVFLRLVERVVFAQPIGAVGEERALHARRARMVAREDHLGDARLGVAEAVLYDRKILWRVPETADAVEVGE